MARLTPKAVAEQIARLRGNVAAVARAFGVTRQAAAEYIAKRPDLAGLLRDAREEMKDHGESALYAAVLSGEAWAVCFFLKTQAKDRGYVERQETHDVTARLELAEEIVDAHAAKDGPPAPRSG